MNKWTSNTITAGAISGSSISADRITSTSWNMTSTISELEKRVNNMEKRFSQLQDFLDYKGMTIDEFNEFIDSRKLAEEMSKKEIPLKVETTSSIPFGQVRFMPYEGISVKLG